jgi:hypothetical protein
MIAREKMTINTTQEQNQKGKEEVENWGGQRNITTIDQKLQRHDDKIDDFMTK